MKMANAPSSRAFALVASPRSTWDLLENLARDRTLRYAEAAAPLIRVPLDRYGKFTQVGISLPHRMTV
jgi:hypothetical protein